MTAKRHILREAERAALLRDGLSNDDLVLLLSTVSRKGDVMVSRERIGELIANHAAGGALSFDTPVQEGFDPAKALQDLKAAKQQRELAVSGNPEQVAAHVKYLTALASNPKDFAGIQMIKSVIESAKSKQEPSLPPETVREASCQYLSMLVPSSLPKTCPATPTYLGGAKHWGESRGL